MFRFGFFFPPQFFLIPFMGSMFGQIFGKIFDKVFGQILDQVLSLSKPRKTTRTAKRKTTTTKSKPKHVLQIYSIYYNNYIITVNFRIVLERNCKRLGLDARTINSHECRYM